jgi:predicted MPP superfamily phosphohydrolase
MRAALAILVLMNAAWWLVLGPLLAPIVPGGWIGILAAALLLLLPLAVVVRGFRVGWYPSARTRVWLIRPFVYGQLFLPLLAGAGLVGLVAGWPLGAAARSGRWAVAVAGVVLLLVAAWGWAGTRRLVVRRLELALEALPPGLEGLRIVQLADLHVGPHTSRRHLERIARAVRAAEPDLIALTGDQVDDYARDMEVYAAALGHLTAPLGVFAIPGNHDIIAGWDAVRRATERLGIRVLVNEALPVARDGARLWIAGTGDPAGRYWRRDGGAAAAPDVERTLAAVPPGEPTLALAHNPALWPALAERGVALTLSGHTHYGQLAIPRIGWSVASIFLEHAMGLHRRGGSVLYISPGTNFWGIPFRIGALPEVTVVTLAARRG